MITHFVRTYRFFRRHDAFSNRRVFAGLASGLAVIVAVWSVADGRPRIDALAGAVVLLSAFAAALYLATLVRMRFHDDRDGHAHY